MELKIVKLLFGILVLVTCASVGLCQQVIGGKPPCGFAGLFSFGDSNSDTGGMSAAFTPIPAPYGSSFFKRPAGRASDGRLLIDFMAENLGLPHLGAYLDTIGTDYRHGANFAAGGATIRRQNETIFENGVSPFSLDMQTVQFTQFKARTVDLYTPGLGITADTSQLPRPEVFSNALYTIDIGQNDLSVGFRKLSEEQLRAALPDIINQLAIAVRQLYQQGARSFWIHNTGPIGCLPQATLYLQNPKPGFLDQYGCIRSQNNVAMEFNRQLKDRVIKLRSELPHAVLTYVDVYTVKYQLIGSARNEGFNDPLKICCGHHENGIHVWCGQRASISGTEIHGAACATPSTYISWDGVHYSQAATHWIANRIFNGSSSDPPLPVTHACYKKM